MNFDFFDDATSGSAPADGDEHIDTDLIDEHGRRIGFLIQRHTLDGSGRDVPPFVRWVSVTKDGEWIRNDNSSFHHTLADAEAWVQNRIKSATARYQRQRGGAAVPRVTRTRRAAKRSSGWRFVLLVACIVLASPFVAVLWLSLTIRR